MVTSPRHILLVEDNEVDAEVFLRSFQRLGTTQTVTVTRDGVEALEMRRGQAGKPHPYVRI